MSTTTLPNIRVSSDLTVRVRLKDGGVAIDWSTLNNIKAHIYSDAQRALAGRCDVSVDAEDSTLLVCSYAANKPQYVGINRVVVSARYMGETKTYDKPAFNFVRWTADQEGEEITIDDPDVDVEIEVEDVTSSILQEAIDAALQAAADAEHAAHLVPLEVLQDCEQATADAIIATAAANAAGIDEVQATVDAQVGTPSVDVDLENKVLSLDFHNMKGETGEAAGFGTASASLTEDGGDPGVTVSASGPDTAKQFAFTFKNLKGDKGDKGDQGNTGSSVEYPYELVNNLTTNDATKGLTAAMGVTLEGEVSQLEAKVDGITSPGDYEEVPVTAKSGYAISTNGQEAASEWWRYFTIPVKPGEKYRISTYAGWSFRAYVIEDENNSVIEIHSYNSDTSLQTADVTIPDGAVVMYVNDNPSYGSGFYSIKKQGVKIVGESVELSDGTNVQNLADNVDALLVPGGFYEMTGLTSKADYSIGTNGSETSMEHWEYFTIPVRPGEKYKVSAYCGWSCRLYVIMSDSAVVAIHDYNSTTSLQTAEITIPANAVVMYINNDTRLGSVSIFKQGFAVSAEKVLLSDESTAQQLADSVQGVFSDSKQYVNEKQKATQHTGGFMASDGVIYESQFWSYYTIPVSVGEQYKVTAFAGSSGAPLWFQLNQSNSVVSRDTTTTELKENTAEVTIVDGVATLLLNARINSAEEAAIVAILKKENVISSDMVFVGDKSLTEAIEDSGSLSDILHGKTLVCCGDSITMGADMDAEGIITPTIDVYQRVGASFVKQAANYPANYGYQIAARNKMLYYCDGISGSTMQGLSDHAGFSLADGRYTTLPDNIDYLTIWFGWNDTAFGTLGTIDDSTNESYFGGYNVVLPYLINKYPFAKIALIVPFGWSAGHRNAVRALANKWGVACWDNYQGGTPLYYGKEESVGVEESIVTANRAKFQANGAHPNFKGHRQLADMIEHFIRGI